MSQMPDESVPSLFTAIPILAALGILLFIAFYHEESVLSAFVMALMALMVLCRYWARLAAPYVSLSVVSDRQRMFPGDEFSLTTYAGNRSYLPIWLQAGGPRLGVIDSCDGELPPVLNGTLSPRGLSTFTWRLRAGRRGVHLLGPSNLVAGDLTGFYPYRLPSFEQTEVLVYPRLVPLKIPELTRREMFGNTRSRHPVVDPICIAGTRDYQPGRPARNIHWRASARHQRWQEKVFEPSAQPKVVISLDVAGFASGQAVEEFERTLEAVASLAVDCERRKVQVGFFNNGARYTGEALADETGQNLSSRRDHPDPPVWLADNILESLARLTLRPACDMVLRLGQCNSLLRGASLLHCVWQPDQSAAAVRGLCQRRGVPVTLLVAGPPASGPEAAAVDGKGFLHLRNLVDLTAS